MVRTPYRSERPLVTMIEPSRVTSRDAHLCVQCSHPFKPHVVLATVHHFVEDLDREVPVGGHIFCPVAKCACHRSWAVPTDLGFDIRAEIRPLTRAAAKRLGAPLQ